MKKITLLLSLCFLASMGYSQSYYFLSGTGSSAPYYQSLDEDYDIVLTTDRANPNSELNDVLSASQTLPFTFNFYGTDFTSYKISDNGYITFDAAESVSNPTNTVLPSATAPKNSIMAFWDDLELEQNQTFLFAVVKSTLGTAPNRSVVIKWFQANHTGRSAEVDELLYFGLVLHEQGGFDIVHEAQLTLGTAYTETATIGCNNGDGTEGIIIEGPSASFPAVTNNAGAADDKVYSFFVGPQVAKDAGIISVTMTKDVIVSNGAVSTVTEVRNYGSDNITSIDLAYTVDGGTLVSDNFATNIAPGAVRSFTHTTAWTPAAAGSFDFVVSLGDVNSAADEKVDNNNDQSFTVNAYTDAPDRTPFYEIFTSSTCGPCTPGNANFHGLINGARAEECTYIKYQQNFPSTGDPYASSQSVARRNFYAINSIPRMEIDGGWDGNANAFTANLHTQAVASFSLVEVGAEFDKWGQAIKTTITVDAIKDLPNARLYAAVFETYNENNIKSNGETEFLQVFKRFLTPVAGDPISIVSGTPLEKTYQVDFAGEYELAADGQSASWININRNHDVEDFNNLRVVVWVQDNTTKEVMNSTYATEILASTKKLTQKVDASIAPNPTNGITNISLDLIRSSNVSVVLTNAMGQKVNNFDFGTVNAGTNTLNVNLSEYSEGVYFLNITTDEGQTSQKIVVSK
ncbi:T9SS type A sorting domain-containing protein [Bacteroidia bacterium]|nr:T9SS type A sorting domain-containing protein [Bacteroidia bacterium]